MTSNLYKPVGDLLQAEQIEDESVTPSGLHVLHTAESSEPVRMRVVATGPEVRDIQAGDVILTDRWAGSAHGDVIFLKQEVVLAVLPEEA